MIGAPVKITLETMDLKFIIDPGINVSRILGCSKRRRRI